MVLRQPTVVPRIYAQHLAHCGLRTSQTRHDGCTISLRREATLRSFRGFHTSFAPALTCRQLASKGITTEEVDREVVHVVDTCPDWLNRMRTSVDNIESNDGMLGCNRLTLNCHPVSCWRKGQAFTKPLVMAAHTHGAGDKRSHAVNSDPNTSRYTAKIELGPETVTQKDGLLPTEDPLKLTLIYPVTGVNPDLPWICLLPGANCYSQDYTFLETYLAGQGYLVAVVDQLHPVTPRYATCLSSVREPQCPSNSWGVVKAAAVNDVYNVLKVHSQQAEVMSGPSSSKLPMSADVHSTIKSVKLDSMVMVGHSLGATVGCLLLSGLAETWQSQPELDPEDDHDPTDSSHNISRYCNNYSRISDGQGNNILKGLIAFEGCMAVSFTEADTDAFQGLAGLSAAPISIPDSTFLTFMDCAKGAAGKSLMQLAYEQATGQNVQYIELSSGNHYAMNDWNPVSAPHQRAPCGLDGGSSNTVTTQEEQEERLMFIGQFADAKIRAEVLHDAAAASFLRGHLQSKSVRQLMDKNAAQELSLPSS